MVGFWVGSDDGSRVGVLDGSDVGRSVGTELGGGSGTWVGRGVGAEVSLCSVSASARLRRGGFSAPPGAFAP